MKNNLYKFGVLLLFFVQLNYTNAQVVWGVGSSVGVAEAQFSTNFVNSTVASGYSTTNWTALTVYESDGTVTPGDAYWVRNLNGISSGGYATGMTPLASPSAANGAALFDSDFMDNGGVQGAFGTGVSPGIHKGELISPTIDLTGYTDEQLAVTFYSYYRRYQIDNYFISISTDDGTTWVESVNIQTLQPVAINADIEGFITAYFNTATQGVLDLTQCRIKFSFEGYYYNAFIDDISISSFSCANNPPSSLVSTTICNDESVVINGTTYNASNPTGTEVLVGAGLFGCDSTINVNLNVLPVLVGTDNTTICAEESIIINGTTYDAGNPTGTEVFTNVGANGCDSTVTVSLNVLPALTGNDNTTICATGSVVINGTTYDAGNPTGTEVFTNVGVNGCDSTVTVSLNVLAAVDVTVDNSLMPILSANQAGATYQWVDCDNGNAPISGEMGQTFTATANGNYAVEVTINGCTETSSCEAVTGVGITEAKNNVVSIYPNPTDGMVNINLGSNNSVVDYSISSIEGKVVETGRTSTNNIIVDLSNESKGVYFIKINNENTSTVYKLIKQ